MDSQQDSIFDASFVEAGALRRRRAIMPIALKIYVWFGMLFGGFAMANMITQMLSSLRLIKAANDPSKIIIPLALMLSTGLLIFLIAFLLWMEVKWAITFNWVVGSWWLCLLLFILMVYPYVAILKLLAPFLLLSIPYFLLLFSIRKKWKKGVRGKVLTAA